MSKGDLTAGSPISENMQSRPAKGRKDGPGGPRLAGASAEARRKAAAVLEVLAGEQSPKEASEVLGIGLPRYYLLEQRALFGLLQACEPAGHKGRTRSPAREIERLREDNARLTREVGRWQALLRAAQRTAGLMGMEKSPSAQKKRKMRRKAPTRAILVARRLKAEPAPGPAAVTVKEATDGEGTTGQGA